jgi:aminopeptidase N
MMKQLFLCFLVALTVQVMAQEPVEDTTWKKKYRYTGERINNLSHTKLEVSFDYTKSYLYGKAWITLSPHFYPTDSLLLDAKGMAINKVSIVKSSGSMAPLTYLYDGMVMKIKLDKTYKKDEKYTIYIDYTAKPDEFEASQAEKMLGVKGLYFINPKGEDKEKPIQIWTQGETESSSAWFPTIDKTNQKTTQEIYMTVPAKYVTLSNGKLVSQKNNSNGTRTDYWKMDLPHAPYLFFMGVGDYAVVKDTWRGKEVNYYVEQEYGPVAKKIFGNTPEMMTYFSKITGVDYPWNKYSQITGREYVAGAMENTTATIHQENAQQDARELVDDNIWEGTIAHELFHQWFGDYVTAENWSNLTLNESFADYSQTLWDEYKYGKDAGDAENFQGMQGYLNSQSEQKSLVRFYYASQEDMFDAVSYQKGGRILHMLRNYVGDSAFFKSLNLYLTTNKFKSAEAHDLRLAFEAVTGRDLNWFFNQWYFGAGHPKLDINYAYEDDQKRVRMIVKQTQTGQVFRLPVAVDIYNGSNKNRQQIWVEKAVDTFYFANATKPDLVNFDGDKIMLCEKKENKNLDQYIHQYNFAGKYLDRREAIDFCGRKMDDPKAVELIKKALKDPYFGLRNLALGKVDIKKETLKTSFETNIADVAKNDPKSTVRGRAIGILGNYRKTEYKSIFEKAITDSSYTVAGNGLEALSKIDSVGALNKAVGLSKQISKGKLDEAINTILIASGNEEVYDRIATKFSKMGISNEAFMMVPQMTEMLAKVKNPEKVKSGVDMITAFRDKVPEQYQAQTSPYINGLLKGLADKKTAAGLTEQATYINSKLQK